MDETEWPVVIETDAPNVMAPLRLLVFVFLLSMIEFWKWVIEYSIVNALSLS